MNTCMSGMGGPSQELSRGLEQLKGEHPSLLNQLESMYNLTKRIELEQDPHQSFSELKSLTVKFKDDLDPHSEREEGVLFPMMGVYIGTTSGPIAVMEYEHDQAKTNINEFLLKGKQIELSAEEMKKAAELIRNAYFILTDHFSKEENVLFPMAERMLTNEEKEDLYKRIQEIK